ncbi:glutaminyl-peptide cyclotransferase isoform X3 [Ranitomeya imitator]|uniref:glutaminyl-peptide cyclotransferase isoform X3 n=1 Tax=Ranitomeya imitator TaxID=111125 RepID=UPI0037E813ED
MVSLCFHRTHSSTRETVRPSGAVLREAPSEPSQPSHSESRSAPPQSGEPAAGPSDVPLAEASVAPSFGSSRQRQRASDRAILPEFLHLSTVFQNGFKALCDKMSNIDRRLETIESELSRPAKHFFSAIQKGMVEHLTPELQISVMQACNNAYVTALQQARVMQSATTMPAVPSLAAMAPTPAAEHHHRAPRAEGHRHRHHRTEPQTSAPARPPRAHRREADPHPEGERRKKRRRRQALQPRLWLLPKQASKVPSLGLPGAHPVPSLGQHGAHPVPSLGLQGAHQVLSLGLPGAGVASQGHWSSLLLPHLLRWQSRHRLLAGLMSASRLV